MDYTELFRNLRRSKGLTHQCLAERTGCHRNTVLNLERRRPVKFRTVLDMMRAMGFEPDSAEVRRMALLWLESVSGVELTLRDVKLEVEEIRKEYRTTVAEARENLLRTIECRTLSAEEIRLLDYAAKQSETLEIIRQIRDLVQNDDGPEKSGSREFEAGDRNLRVAED